MYHNIGHRKLKQQKTPAMRQGLNVENKKQISTTGMVLIILCFLPCQLRNIFTRRKSFMNKVYEKKRNDDIRSVETSIDEIYRAAQIAIHKINKQGKELPNPKLKDLVECIEQADEDIALFAELEASTKKERKGIVEEVEGELEHKLSDLMYCRSRVERETDIRCKLEEINTSFISDIETYEDIDNVLEMLHDANETTDLEEMEQYEIDALDEGKLLLASGIKDLEETITDFKDRLKELKSLDTDSTGDILDLKLKKLKALSERVYSKLKQIDRLDTLKELEALASINDNLEAETEISLKEAITIMIKESGDSSQTVEEQKEEIENTYHTLRNRKEDLPPFRNPPKSNVKKLFNSAEICNFLKKEGYCYNLTAQEFTRLARERSKNF